MKLIFYVACTLARFPAKLYPASLCFGTYAKGSFVAHYCFNDGRASAVEGLSLARWVFDPDGALSQ
jgi:hypothetical protein